MNTLPRDFFNRDDVVTIARELLGKYLVTEVDGVRTAGMITETEAYDGVRDRACHAYGGKRTKRTEVMYRQGGTAYVYLCYGIHHLFNVVTNAEGTPDAVLIRSIRPAEGIDTILERRGHTKLSAKTASGPGTLTQALGIHTQHHNGLDLFSPPILIEDHGVTIAPNTIEATPRIGIDYAGEDALLPYRFVVSSEQ